MDWKINTRAARYPWKMHRQNYMHDNDDSPTSNVVDNDSNCLRDTSDSNESSSFLNGTSTHGDSKVFFNGLN